MPNIKKMTATKKPNTPCTMFRFRPTDLNGTLPSVANSVLKVWGKQLKTAEKAANARKHADVLAKRLDAKGNVIQNHAQRHAAKKARSGKS